MVLTSDEFQDFVIPAYAGMSVVPGLSKRYSHMGNSLKTYAVEKISQPLT
jgi:hypothetical protein